MGVPVQGPMLARVVKVDDETLAQLAVRNAPRIADYGVFIEYASDENKTTVGPVPVMQPYAGVGPDGAAYGGQFIPPVGCEVLVDFLHGDPEWPVVLGCVEYPDTHFPHQGEGTSPIVNLFMRATPLLFWIKKVQTRGNFGEGLLSRRSLLLTGEDGDPLFIFDTDRDLKHHVGGDHIQTVHGAHRICVVGHSYELQSGYKKEWHVDNTYNFHIAEKKMAMYGDVSTHTEGLFLSATLDGGADLVLADHTFVELGVTIFLSLDAHYERTEGDKMQLITLDIFQGDSFERDCETGLDLVILKQWEIGEELTEEIKMDLDLILQEKETTETKTEQTMLNLRLMQTESVTADKLNDLYLLSIHV